MSTEITIRHVKLSVALQNAAQKKADKLSADYPAVEFVRIVFDQEGPKYTVSLAVQGGQKTSVGASAKDADATAALNAVFDKANAQLRRASKKRQDVRK
jgi:ribosomal subunit interface protein